MSAIRTIGIMTGNSLDGVDVVLTEFSANEIKDLAGYTKNYPLELTLKMLKIRQLVKSVDAQVEELEQNEFFVETINEYTTLVAETINEFLAQENIAKSEIAALGFHGQTCDHFPPSIAKGQPPYTLQVGNAQLLADLTGLPVVYDFRSDDVMQGGEGAPLAPVHNLHISRDLKSKGIFPVAFCNAGNTGNIAIISEDDQATSIVKGWDVGPFNHLPDYLMRTHKNKPCDYNAEFGNQGKIVPELLGELFHNVAVDNDGKNFYLQTPPKSSDPSWYKILECLNCQKYSFEETLRTTEYLSTYAYFHTLSYVPENVKMPSDFLIFGGGWKNPLVLEDFKKLLKGKGPILEEHRNLFASICQRFTKETSVDWSDKFGYSGQYMEARIFADMAYCKIIGEPFTFPETSGCNKPTIGGIFCYPQKDSRQNEVEPRLWNRASKGWQKKQTSL